MATLADMKARIADEIARDGLDDEIGLAIADAIKTYQRESFRFSRVLANAPPTFPTEIGRAIYTATDNANIGSLFSIDRVFRTNGNTIEELDRSDTPTLILQNQVNTMAGEPDEFAYDGVQLVLAPVPSAVQTITLWLFRNVAAPAADGTEGNVWMNEAEALIRSRAKYELSLHKTRNYDMAKMMSPLPPNENGGVIGAAYREWRALKGEANRVVSRGRVKPMRF